MIYVCQSPYFRTFVKLKNENITTMNLNKLDPDQLKAVQTTQGYVVDIAGAGSGKTTALTYRYAYIVKELGIPPSSILCVTFTNKAAKEMKERIEQLIGKACDTSFIRTHHSFCVKVLLRDIEALTFSRKFTIMDVPDQKSVLKAVYDDLSIGVSEMPLKDMLAFIEKRKTSDTWEDAVRKLIAPTDPIVPVTSEDSDIEFLKYQIYLKYLCFQRKNYALDFTDLLTFTVFLFRHHKTVLAYWSNKFVYQMVDEAQDNSHIQWELIRLLSDTHKNLFVVGDPDQAIYSFRGARPEGLVSFSRKFTPCQTIVMARNYRSTGHILGAANNIIRQNQMRVPKDLYTTNQDGEKIEWMHAGTEEEECEYVAGKILSLQRNGVPTKDIAILYRSSYQSRVLEQTLVKNQIPYVVWGGTRFFEREEVKNCLAYLRLVAQADDLAFLRVINYPSRKLGKAFVTAVKTRSAQQQISYLDTLRNNISTPELGKKTAAAFIQMIDELRTYAADNSIANTMTRILDLTGIRQDLLKNNETERLENIIELISSIVHYEIEHANDESPTIDQYLQEVSLLTNIDGKDDPKAIKMMTIHQSKGLEYPYVFVIGMAEGNMPHARAVSDSPISGLEEERRLAYVAVTRAKLQLFISDSDGYNAASGSQRAPSRFISEMGAIHIHPIIPDYDLPQETTSQTSIMDYTILPEVEPALFKVGQIINHPYFGKGTILAVDKVKGEYSIRFQNSGSILPISVNCRTLVVVS